MTNAGPRADEVSGLQLITKLGGSCSLSTASSPDAQDELAWPPANLRLANDGISARELELLDCKPVAGDAGMQRKLWSLGVRRTAGLYFEAVVFLPNGRFEFARDIRDASGAVVAVVMPALDDIGQLIDLAAWLPETGRLALLLGRVSMLGQDNLYGCRTGEPLALHESALDWLRADREGVVVIDPRRASPLLRMVEPLGVKSAAFGRRLQEAMTIRPPRIVVAQNRRAT